MSRKLKITILSVLGISIAVVMTIKAIPQLGASITKERIKDYEQITNHADGVFQNTEHTPMQAEDASWFSMIKEFLKKGENREPETTIETQAVELDNIKAQSEPKFVWLGHSSVFAQLEQFSILVDPVFSGTASPFSFTGPKEYAYSSQYNKQSLPAIDIILITHDHYDHLDYETIKEYKDSVKLFITPLGVGAHLEKWGVSPDKIKELNWWNSFEYKTLTFTATPARHFSGRGLLDRNKTLWASWVLQSSNHKVFFGGDSGYGDHFKKIGEHFKGFDIAFIECGQYNESWPYIHMMPEESAQACLDLKAKKAIPVHWGKFTLALHTWTDPVERFTQSAKVKFLPYYTPIPGEVFTFDAEVENLWWMNSTVQELAEVAH